MRVLSGIKPTGDITIGNYIGAMRHWADFQTDDNEVFYFVADLHSLNTRQDPKDLRARTLDLVAWLLTCGIDPERSSIFIQSMVPAHAQLGIILENYVTMGELNRMTQYKDKAQKTNADGLVAGFYTYPALMTADIVLYDADIVPVGDDQTQHVELARDIVNRFNHLYGDTLQLPKVHKTSYGARIMSLDDPTRKMSKSDPNSYILLLEDADSMKRKIKRAVTDSGDEVRTGADKPALTNLIHIYAAFADQTPQQIEQEFADKNYGEFKNSLADLIVVKLTTLQSKFNDIRSDEKHLIATIQAGNAKASDIAERKLAQVKAKIGLL